MNIIWDHDSTQGILSYAVTLFDSTGNTVVVPETLLNPLPNMSYRFNGLTPGTQYTLDVDINTITGRSDFVRGLQYTRKRDKPWICDIMDLFVTLSLSLSLFLPLTRLPSNPLCCPLFWSFFASLLFNISVDIMKANEHEMICHQSS